MLQELLILTLLHCALSYSSGAPSTACRALMPLHLGVPSSATSPYRVVVEGSSYTPGQPLNVLLESTDGSSFKGFLIVARAIGSNVNIGFFDARGTTQPRWIQKSCDNETLTHTSALSLASRGKPRLELSWTPPLNLETEFLFMVTFVEEFRTFWLGQRSAVISKGAVETTTTPTTTSTATPTSTSTTTPTTTSPSLTTPPTIPTATPTPVTATTPTTMPKTTSTATPTTISRTTQTTTQTAPPTTTSSTIQSSFVVDSTTSVIIDDGIVIAVAPDATTGMQAHNQTRNRRRKRRRKTTPNPDEESYGVNLQVRLMSIWISVSMLLIL